MRESILFLNTASVNISNNYVLFSESCCLLNEKKIYNPLEKRKKEALVFWLYLFVCVDVERERDISMEMVAKAEAMLHGVTTRFYTFGLRSLFFLSTPIFPKK
jgi:hypothetical protein